MNLSHVQLVTDQSEQNLNELTGGFVKIYREMDTDFFKSW
jgi:hypothetical protein